MGRQNANICKFPDSSQDLDRIVEELLNAAGVGNRLPTPEEDIIQCANLVKEGIIDLEEYRLSLRKQASKALLSGLRKIVGLLDLRKKVILIPPETPESKRIFVTFHEVGHKIIPWHPDAYDYFEDDKNTLRWDMGKKFEAEANYCSSRIIFQGNRFGNEARDYELSLGTPIMLREKYGCSYHSAFRHYVDTSKEHCALLVLNRSGEIDPETGIPYYNLRYQIISEKFMEKYNYNFYKRFGPEFDFIKNINPVGIYTSEVDLYRHDGAQENGIVEVWTNQYDIFIFLREKRKRILPSKKIIIARS